MFNKDGSNPDRLRYPEHLDEDPGDEDRDLDYWLSELDFSDLDRYDADGEPTGLLLDVPYVPSDSRIVDAMLDLGEVSRDDLLYDLGCGDGRIVVAAAKKVGCKAKGFDVDPQRIKESLENVRKNKIEHLVKIEQKDIFKLDLSPANVVTLYLLPSLNVKLIPQLEKLKPGSRIVSHDFDMKGVQPDRMVHMTSQEDGESHTIYLWTVPLKKEPGHEPTGQQ